MTHFLVLAKDGSDDEAPARRLKHREEHLKIGKEQADRGERILGGPLLDENDQMVGSVIITNFETREDLDKWLENEPYVTGNVWQDIQIMKCNAKLAKDR